MSFNPQAEPHFLAMDEDFLGEQSARALERLARDLEKLITQKRIMGAFRVVLKKDIVADHRLRLERAKTFLLLAQQTYLSMQQTYHT